MGAAATTAGDVRYSPRASDAGAHRLADALAGADDPHRLAGKGGAGVVELGTGEEREVRIRHCRG